MGRHDKANILLFAILRAHLKMAERELGSGVKWQGALKQKGAKQTDVKQGSECT
jgi:hypothetical protein